MIKHTLLSLGLALGPLHRDADPLALEEVLPHPTPTLMASEEYLLMLD